jgi:outer membrane protein OmpA-like peptidoglycan-associated protein
MVQDRRNQPEIREKLWGLNTGPQNRVRRSVMQTRMLTVLIITPILALSGCSSLSRTQKGGAAGAATGAVVGGVIGHQAGNTAAGAIIGAAIGGAAGAYIGHYMDEQAAEMERDLEGAQVERIGEGIKITFDSGLLFDVDKAALKSQSKDELEKLSVILNKYDDTEILLEGHTDATGSEEHNLELSRARAQSVANFLASQKVRETRFTIMGYGESQPIAPNDTADNRALNRRVEVAIYANDDLKKTAEKKAGE